LAIPGAGKPRQNHARTRTRGIYRTGSRSQQSYQATVFCFNMALGTRAVETLEKAIAVHTALVLIKAALSESMLASPSSSVALVRAVDVACSAAGIERVDLGLTVRPVISALSEVGRQIHGNTTTDLAAGLAQRRELLEAKSSGWPALRTAWVKILAQKNPWEAESIVNAARHAHCLHRCSMDVRQVRQSITRQETTEERNAREIASAVQAVEQALAAEGRQAKAQAKAEAKAQRTKDRQEAEQRASRRRWAADPQRTTEELIAGPPPGPKAGA